MDPYKTVLQFVDNFINTKSEEARQLPGKIKNLPQRFAEDYQNTMRIGRLPKDNPEVQSFHQRGKDFAMNTIPYMGLSAPIAKVGVAQHISKPASLLLSRKEVEATRLLRGGAKPAELVKKGFTMGDIQKANQRNKGLGLLADFDNASRAKNTELMRQIADAIDNMPANSPYAAYKGQFKNVIPTSPVAPPPQLNIGAGLSQAQASAGQKGYNAPLAGFEAGLQEGTRNAQQKLLEIMGRK